MPSDEKLASKWTRSRAIQIRTIIERMGLCGCGSGAHWACVLTLLERAEDHDKNGSFYQWAKGADDPRDAWVEFGAKVLDSWDLIEHGTGIGYAWLTDDGKLLLDFLRDFGTEDHDMNDGTGHPMWSIEFSWELEKKDGDTYDEWAKR